MRGRPVSTCKTRRLEPQRVAAYRTGPEGNASAKNLIASVVGFLKGLVPSGSPALALA